MSRICSAITGLNDDVLISEDLIGRLHQAKEDSVLRLVPSFSADVRANLATLCYRKSHLREIGLAIAATCELRFLVREMGPVLGQVVLNQPRNRPRGIGRMGVRPRSPITLARYASGRQAARNELDEVRQGNVLGR